MTARDVIAAMLRLWYVVGLGVVLTVAALYVTARQPPVYWTQFNVVLLGPPGTEDTSVLDDPIYGLEPLTGVLATKMNEGRPPHPTGDVDATMVGQGRVVGVEVRVPNLGTQWRTIYSANYLDVQVAGPTPDAVSTAATGATEELASMLEIEQENLGIPPELRAQAVPSSAEPVIYPVAGSRSRAAAATALSGAAITLAIVHWLEAWRRRASLRSLQKVIA